MAAMDPVAAGGRYEGDAARLAGAEIDFSARGIARQDARGGEKLLGGEVVTLSGAIDEGQRDGTACPKDDRVGPIAVGVEVDGLGRIRGRLGRGGGGEAESGSSQ